MAKITSEQIHLFLTELALRYTNPATIILLGGGALCLLGSERPTADIDYVGDDIYKDELQQAIEQLANDIGLIIDPVPISQFVPIPADADKRRIPVGRFGEITAYVLDPYMIALSKLDRGFESDLEDIQFLLRGNLISIEQLEIVVQNALQNAARFDLNTKAIREHLNIVRNF
jgi:hypothetical protein